MANPDASIPLSAVAPSQAWRRRFGAWAIGCVLPIVNLLVALVVSGLVVRVIGQDPVDAMSILVNGAIGDGESIGYTLFYATDFMLTGLAVSIALHTGLFNIGADGQAYVAGLGVTLICLHANGLPLVVILPCAIVAATVVGAAWAFLPGYLQAKRGSHIVVTTIMFNFIASAMMTYLIVHLFHTPGVQAVESATFDPAVQLPTLARFVAPLGFDLGHAPLNLAFPMALLCCALVYWLIWHTRLGHQLRAAGHNPVAAAYAGISVPRMIILAMLISGALSGLVAINETMGAQHRLILDFPNGAGFVGLAVALMGRNHPVGIILTSLLFGALYQGGAGLAMENQEISSYLVVVIQGLIVLFCGALEVVFERPLAAVLRWAGIGRA